MFQQSIIIGHLGRDPELRYTPSGKPVCDFSVATNLGKDKPPVWWKVTAWGKLAENCNQHLAKGMPVQCVGTATASAWQDRDGNPRASLELVARNVTFLGRTPAAWAPAEVSEPVAEETEIPF